MNKETHAWIFVKSDSIDFPERNRLLLNGKPLIAYTIEAALKSRHIKKVFISTDSPDIAAVSEQYGAIVPFLRPQELSTGKVPIQQAWKHAVEWNRNQTEFPQMDIMVALPMTVPLRSAEDIDAGVELYKRGEADMVVAVSPSNRNPAYNMVRMGEKNDISLIVDNDDPFARQRSFTAYDLTNMYFICSAEFAAEETNFFRRRTKALEVAREKSFDIRSKIDLKLAEIILAGDLK